MLKFMTPPENLPHSGPRLLYCTLNSANGILRRYHQRQIDVADVERLAIQIFRALIREGSADLVVAQSQRGSCPTMVPIAVALRNHGRRQCGKIETFRPFSGISFALRLVDHLPEGRTIRLQQRRLARYFHRLTDFAQLHGQVDARRLLDLHNDIRLLRALEAGLLGNDPVAAWKKIWKLIQSFGACFLSQLGASIQVC